MQRYKVKGRVALTASSGKEEAQVMVTQIKRERERERNMMGIISIIQMAGCDETNYKTSRTSVKVKGSS